ncbi:hypothetical protein [Amycolatopsis sp. NPDC059657]|uniref:hypothetical protein n=1 Tax=Amycolatopsis sp. NPDC059657 TaxID=3346899 RepID=UPI00366AD3D6
MEDIDFRTALQDYVTREEAPSTLAEGAIISASKQARRLRRYAAVGTVTAVVAAVTAGISLLPDRNAPPQLHKAAPVACPGQVQAETSAQLKARLECVLGNAIRAELEPGARIVAMPYDQPWVVVPPPGSDPLALALSSPPAADKFILRFQVTDSQGVGSAEIHLVPYDGGRDPKGALGDCDRYLSGKNALTCRDELGPRDGVLRLRTEGVNGLENDIVELHTTDSLISIDNFNYATPGVPYRLGKTAPVTRQKPPFDWAQLVRIVSDPGLAR